MMNTRIPFAVMGACVIAVATFHVREARAIDRFWQGDVSNAYGGAGGASAGNWNTLGGMGTLSSPRATSLERAVIGTDSPDGALNCNDAPFGCPVISSPVAIPGGIALGLRVIDYEDLNFNGLTNDFLYDNFDPENPTQVVAPFFDPSTLVGKLTITGGSVSPVTTSAANFGADGRVLVGVQGRGYLTMTGGTLTLNNTALVVAGPNTTTDAGTLQELGPSTVDLSGTATVNLTGGTGAIANFDRRLKVTGPNVVFNSTGRIRFVGTSLFTAEITSATSHSVLNTQNNALLGGALAIQFSGAGATRDPVSSLGETWTLIKSTLSDNALDGNFSNLGPGGVVQVTGLDAAHAAPLGANYRIKKVAVGNTSELQLSYEQTLVLTVNRNTGAVSIRNPLAGQLAIDSYSITSARGSMLPGYAGLGSSTPGAGPWEKPEAAGGANTVTSLSEVQDPTTNPAPYNLFSVPTVSLGTGFSRTGVGANVANFGSDGEDLIFEFSGPNTGGVLRGQIEYVGTKFENDLVLRVNPNTGEAFLKNDSLVTLTLDGFSILSTTGALNGTAFASITGGDTTGAWQKSPAISTALTQTNLTGSTTLMPNQEVSIGDISSVNFTSAEAQAGLTLQYLLTQGGMGGDYNDNGIVDAADYTVWRNNLGSLTSLPNDNTPGVGQDDYDLWKASFMQGSAFRVGTVVFDATAGSGSLSVASVPEPGTCLLLLIGLAAVGRVRCPGKQQNIQNRETLMANGATTMCKRNRILAAMLAGVTAVLMMSASASAATQGIPLVNGDLSLPGPLGTKVVAFNETGVPFAPTDPVIELSSGQLAGGIPGWTFTGGSGIAATGEINAGVANELFGDNLPGDSGTEGIGNDQPDNEIILSTFDGKAFQTSSFNLIGITANEKYSFAFDVKNIFTPGLTIDGIGPMAQLTARLYYVNASSVKQTIGSPLVINEVGDRQRAAFEFHGNNPTEMALLTSAMGRPVGIEFDTTSFEADPTRVERSWIGIDNVIMQIQGIKEGDLNGDGNVNATDYAILRDNLNESHTYVFQGELTGDYIVNLNDFRAFKNAFDAVNGAGSFAALVSGVNVPEPTSLGLFLMCASVFGIFFRRERRHFGPSKHLIALAVIAGSVLTTASPSLAIQFAFDPFLTGSSPANGEYLVSDTSVDPVINPLVGQNPTIGPESPSFFRDGWTGDGLVVLDTGLPYLGTPSPGGSINGFGRTSRYLNNTGNPLAVWDDTTTGNYYMSFVVNFGNLAAGGNMGYRAVEFFPTGVVPGENRIGDIGYNEYDGRGGGVQQNAATAKMTFNLYGYQIIASAPDSYAEDGINHLLVLKWSFSTEADGDSISLYLNPSTLDEPVIPSAVVTGINASLGAIGAASFGSAIAGATTQMDDIRIGDSFIDVMPELPKPGDANGDDIVNLLDYEIILAHLNLSGSAVPNMETLRPDVTGDGKVSIADYRLWKDKREDLMGSGAAGLGVPEPSSSLLFIVGMILAAISVNGRGRARS